MDLLQDAGVEVLTGEAYLGREINWVHTGEIADIAQYLSGGEALLTAATGLGQEAAQMRSYVRELADAGARLPGDRARPRLPRSARPR